MLSTLSGVLAAAPWEFIGKVLLAVLELVVGN